MNNGGGRRVSRYLITVTCTLDISTHNALQGYSKCKKMEITIILTPYRIGHNRTHVMCSIDQKYDDMVYHSKAFIVKILNRNRNGVLK